MKNFKKIFTILAIMLISLSGMLFGCGDKYAGWNIKVDLQSDVIELFLGDELDEETQPSSISFLVNVVGADVNSSTIRYNKNGSNAFDVSLEKKENSNSTKVTLTARNLCENAKLTLLTAEGNKSKNLTIKVTCPIKDMVLNTETGYKPFAVVGESRKINTAKAIEFLPKLPVATNQRDVNYSMPYDYQGIEVLPDGTIIVDEDIDEDVTITVTATSVSNPSITLDINVDVIKPIDEVKIEYEGEEVETGEELRFSTNMLEETYKILTINPSYTSNDYFINLEVIYNDNSDTNSFIIEKLDFETFGITASKICNAELKITARLKDYEYVSPAKILKLVAVETPSIITYQNRQNTNDIIIYDVYQNGLGEMFTVNVGGPSAYDRRYVISVSDPNDKDKISIVTGRRDSSGNLIKIKPYFEDSTDYDILTNGTVVYIMANYDALLDINQETIKISFVAYGSLNLKGNIVEQKLNLNIKNGVTQISVSNNLVDSELLVPVKLLNEEEGTKLLLEINANEYTNNIYTEFEENGIILNENSIEYQYSEIVGSKRQFAFTLWGSKEGVYSIRFLSQNNKYIDVKIRVFIKITDITITTDSIASNSDLAVVHYHNDGNYVTLNGDDASIVLRNGGEAKLNINTYNENKLQNCVKTVSYEYEKQNIVRIDKTNKIIGYNIGKTKVFVLVEVYDNTVVGQNKKQFNLSFEVSVETLLLSASLNEKNITLYTKNTLSDFVSTDGLTDKQRYGEFKLKINVNPSKTELLENSIVVRKSGTDINSLNVAPQFNYNINSYEILLTCDQLPSFKNQGSARLTFTISQYQRVIVLEAEILIKNAEKVDTIYNIKKVEDNTETLVQKQANICPKIDEDGNPVLINGKITYESESYLYLYFDSRTTSLLLQITFNYEINPKTALNGNLKYIVRYMEGYENVLLINNENITLLNPGYAFLYLCCQDSYNSALGNIEDYNAYSVKTLIVIKVADGSSKFTALDISTEKDLKSINNNVESLQKYYRITKNISLSSNNWTPIGYINGTMHTFNGNIDGIISNEFGEIICANIYGINFNSLFEFENSFYCGFIGILDESALIENLNLQITNVNLNNQVSLTNTLIGGVAGVNYGDIENVHTIFANNGKVLLRDKNIVDRSNTLYFGGIVGINNGNVNYTYTSGDIHIQKDVNNSRYLVGGLVGENNKLINGETYFFNQVEFRDEYNSILNIVINSASISNEVNATGGVVGLNKADATLKNVSFDGSIKAKENVGGIAGINYSNLYNLYSSGVIEGTQNVGGLVGVTSSSTNNKIKLNNSSVNMFDYIDKVVTSITGLSNVGGLVGKAEKTIFENVYVKSYVSYNKENFAGDLQAVASQSQTFVGGAIGYATDVNLEKVYSQITINAPNSKIGGLIGYADNAKLTNTYERNTVLNEASLLGLAIADNSGSTIDYFYSSNSGKYFGSDSEEQQRSNCFNKVNFDDEYWSWILNNTFKWSKMTNITDKSQWQGRYDWFLSNDNIYPYLIFNNDEILSVEAPTEISLELRNSEQINAIEDYEDTYVLYSYNNTAINFDELFNVNIKPEDTILNISREYNLKSSDENVIQITGRNSATYKLKPISSGKITLTVYSKLNAEVKKEITIFVVETVKDFKLNSSKYVIVGSTQELVISVNTNFKNNNNYYINYYGAEDINGRFDGNIFINSTNNTDDWWFKNNEKMFIYSSKSGHYTLKYSLYVTLDINGEEKQIELKNYITQSKALQSAFGELEFEFKYGIKSFVCDTTVLTTGLNDYAYLTYYVEGDDLRLNDKLPYFEWPIKDKNSPSILNSTNCWDVKLSYIKVYYGDRDVILYAKLKNETSSSNTINDYEFVDIDNQIITLQNDQITKLEILLIVKINKEEAETSFRETTNLSINCYVNAKIKIVSDDEYNKLPDYIKQNVNRDDVKTDIILNRQKVDNIALDFYTNSEKLDNKYEFNEMPSKIITSGVEGLLKIHLTPHNAEVKEVIVTYSNQNNYNMSIQQMLFYNDETGSDKNRYIERKPYAVAVQNGISLYKESNYYNLEDEERFEYDGYLYVSCLIPSATPTGQEFTLNINALCSNGYRYTASTVIKSKLQSQIAINYNFNGQIVDEYAYIAKNTEYEFFVDYTELIENDNYEEFDPKKVFKDCVPNNVDIDFSKENGKYKIEKPTLSRPFYRVYYTIKSTDLKEIELVAQKEKVENNVKVTVKSNQFTFNCIPFVITDLEITNGGNNTLTIYQSSPTQMDVNLVYEWNGFRKIYVDDLTKIEEELKDDNKKAELEDINARLKNLENHISRNLKYWFGVKNQSYKYTTLESLSDSEKDDINNSKYLSIYVQKISYDDINSFVIGVRSINTTAKIYCEVPIDYTKLPTDSSNYTNLVEDYLSTTIGDNEIGLFKKKADGSSDNYVFVQYIRQYLNLNLSSDASSEHPIPIKTEEEFVNMVNGIDTVNYYALDNNIKLKDYTPRSLQNINFNGNMHTITIENFNIVADDSGEEKVYNTNYGLFNSIDTNSVVKNLIINYEGLVSDNDANYTNIVGHKKDDDYNYERNFNFKGALSKYIDTFNFGGVCIDNNGVIYNTEVKSKLDSQLKTLEFNNYISTSTKIAGIAVNNSGYISYSKSLLSMITNCGHIAGLVVNNSKKISNCKVVINNTIENTLTVDENSLTAGFVVKNSGSIFGSYISTHDGVACNSTSDPIAKVKSNANVAGFVNTNSGTISNSYSNVEIVSDKRSSGFVYDNSGKIESSYSSCKIEDNSSVHTPFIGTNSNGKFQNSGEIFDCYYIGENKLSYSEYEATKEVKHLDYDTELENAKNKMRFAKFVFTSEDSGYLTKPTGTWRIENNVPKLIDADLTIYHQEEFKGISYSGNSSYFNWVFKEDSPSYGKRKILNNKINPRIIYGIETWNNVVTEKDNRNDYFVLVKDIDCNRISAPLTVDVDFGGVLLGSNMEFTNLNLKANASNSNKNYGLFKTIQNTPNNNDNLPECTLIKDIKISVKQIVANNANNIGTLAGYINDAYISNLEIDATDVVAQAKNMVGILAGIINDSTVTKISITGSVNAGYRESLNEIYNYFGDDLDTLTSDSVTTKDVPYSYVGCIAGAVIGKSTINYASITGNNRAIGYFAGIAVGLLDTDSKLLNVGIKVENNQFIRAYSMAGGLVGENRGIIDRCYVENTDQKSIDSEQYNKIKNNRNLDFFVGTPYFIGGLVGFNNGGTIKNSYSKLDVRTNNYVTKASGGLVGLDVGGNIDCCYATGSVSNRYIIGGIVGVVTNKTTLLGYHEETGVDGKIDSKRNNELFANDLSYNNEMKYFIDEKRGSYIAGKIDGYDNGIQTKLLIQNTLASNKWLLTSDNTGLSDLDYLQNANSGLFIGMLVDKRESDNSVYINDYASSNLDALMLTDNDTDINLCNNYINSQVLKGNPKTTVKSIKLMDIHKCVIDYNPNGANADGTPINNDDYYGISNENGEKSNLLNAINNASIGGYNSIIDIVYMDDMPNIKIAKCTINEVLVSFENLLNRDEIMLSDNLQTLNIDSEEMFNLLKSKVFYIEDGENVYANDESEYQPNTYYYDLRTTIFGNYNSSIFDIPSKQNENVIYYPQIVTNINI